jgi:hypothetical protein
VKIRNINRDKANCQELVIAKKSKLKSCCADGLGERASLNAESISAILAVLAILAIDSLIGKKALAGL